MDNNAAFLTDVLSGFAQPQKSLSPRWFYDARGSELFEDITRLPEYYLTRAETRLLTRIAPEISQHAGTGGSIIEYGSGSSTKTPLLLDAIKPETYIPIDVSQSALDGAASSLKALYPALSIRPVLGDFTVPMAIDLLHENRVVGFFPGSTIGNFDPDAAQSVLQQLRNTQPNGSWLILGLDQCNDIARLHAAYNDAAGVTAAFNLNLLHRINRELDGNIPIDQFCHDAFFNIGEGRIEMHLVAQDNVRFTVSGQSFTMQAGESIHTENSYKYSGLPIEAILETAGWQAAEHWADAETGFAIYLVRSDEADHTASKINRNTL